jgi:hypothetical protein
MVGDKDSSQLFDGLLFPGIFQTFRMSIQPTKLIITASALAVICLAGWIMDFSKTVPVLCDNEGNIVETELQAYVVHPAPDVLRSEIQRLKESGDRSGVFLTLWNFAGAKFKGAVDSVIIKHDIEGLAYNIIDYFKAVGWALRRHPVYCIIFFVIKLAVISIGGGAICRIAALQFARGEKPGLTEALRFSIKRFTSFFTAPLAPLVIIAFIGLFIFLLGLMGNIPRAGEIIVGISMPLALIAGGLIAVIFIGAAAGFNLIFPAVAYDGSDCFDAISRSFSYVYARPWRMGFYTAIAAVYGSICYMFVRSFAFLSIWITRWFLQVILWAENGSGNVNKLAAIWPEPKFGTLLGLSKPLATNWTEAVAVFLVHLSVLVVVGLVVSFIISFYFSANTIIYSLMRSKVDHTARDDIYMNFDEADVEPAEIESKPQQEQPSSPPEPEPDSSSTGP